MTESKSLQKIGSMAETERLQKGYSRKAFAELAGVNIRTLMDFEDGVRRGRPLNLAKIEKALQWSPGTIDWALSLSVDELENLGADHLRDWSLPKSAVAGMLKVEHLTDDELITELTRRFRNYAIAASEAALPESLRAVPDWRKSITSQGDVDLAAAPRSKKERLKFDHQGKAGEETQDGDSK